MKFRWGRGLLRLWAVAALTWIFIVGWFADGPKIWDDFIESRTVEFTLTSLWDKVPSPPGVTVTVPVSDSREDAVRALAEFLKQHAAELKDFCRKASEEQKKGFNLLHKDGSVAAISPGCDSEGIRRITASPYPEHLNFMAVAETLWLNGQEHGEAWQHYVRMRDRLRVAAEIAFLPPFVLLIMGVALRWALKGFAPR